MKDLVLEPCLPPRWARGGHAQTLFGHFLPSPVLKSKGRRVDLRTDDGDLLVCFHQGGDSDTVVYLFHGLAGSSDSSYMHRTAKIALEQGHTVVMMNHRGCGEGAGQSRRPYHSGRAEDLSTVIEWGRKTYPRHRHLGIGFSMSGNALLLLLSGARGRTAPDLGISVNAPIHLESAALLLKRGLNRIYDADFVRRCAQDAARARGEKLRIPFGLTLHDFDTLYTAEAGEFTSREHYYESCSTWERIRDIKAPTFIFTAKDDPFVCYSNYEKAELSSSVRLLVQESGGHMGYLSREKTPLGTLRWQDYALDQAIRSLRSL